MATYYVTVHDSLVTSACGEGTEVRVAVTHMHSSLVPS